MAEVPQCFGYTRILTYKSSQFLIFICVERITHEQVSENLCDVAMRPTPKEEICNSQPCPAFWDVGEWSECSKTCGPGIQHRQCSVPCGVGQRTRDIKCVDNLGDVVDDEECNLNLKPEDSENCDAGPCARSWFLTEWSERCSAECGNGTQTRGVVCLMNHISSLPLEGCGNEKPMESKPCNFGLCNEKVEWFTGPWDQCSTECGNGTKSRSVVCLKRSNISLVVVEPSECSRLEKPPTENNCYLKKCGAKWFTTEWSACTVPYRVPYHVYCALCAVPYRVRHTVSTVQVEQLQTTHIEWQQEDLLSIAASEDMAAQEFPSEEGNSDSATPVVVISSAYAAD
ncbi:UNVERIFIED_CONTAM: hypothetical protein FKN15_035548 [Acipenser sinensis]